MNPETYHFVMFVLILAALVVQSLLNSIMLYWFNQLRKRDLLTPLEDD